jgi:hypothetical protein
LGLKWHCVGTIVGEETFFVIYFCWIEGVEAALVAVAFCASFEQNVKRMDFVI